MANSSSPARPPEAGSGAAAPPPRIDAAPWARLTEAQGVEAVAEPWLAILCATTDAAEAALFDARALAAAAAGAGESGGAAPSAPTERAAGAAVAERAAGAAMAESAGGAAGRLASVAVQAAQARGPMAVRPAAADARARLAHPVLIDGKVRYVVAAAFRDAAPSRLRAAGRGLLWASAWLEARARAEAARDGEARAAALRDAHAIFAALLEIERLRPAALALVGRLAALAQADRVTLGLRSGGGRRTRLIAVSHAAEAEARFAVGRLTEAAMDEALDQRAALRAPAPQDEVNGTRAQEALAAALGPAAVLTLPFRVHDLPLGAATFERAAARPFSPEEVAHLDFVVALAGPLIHQRKRRDQRRRARDGQLASRMAGAEQPRRMGARGTPGQNRHGPIRLAPLVDQRAGQRHD
ncbi:MAG: hypothetical protein AAFU61_13210, partial [Pseudomonadota bacterium]